MRAAPSLRGVLAGAAILAACGVQAQDEAKKKNGIFDALAGPGGGDVRFVTAPAADGKPAVVRARTNDTGEFQGLEATGELVLTTPQFKLACENLTFDGTTEKMTAWGDVSIEQEGVRATGNRLTYDSATRRIVISENPHVTQSMDDNETTFSGMDEFTIITADDGRTEVLLTGRGQMQMDMKEKPGAGADAQGGAPAPSSGGFNKLGKNVRIIVSPRGGMTAPSIAASIAESALDTFRAEGSVRVETDDFSLRSDRLEFGGKEQVLTASSNVFMKQDSIDADCGRMVYDLTTDVITLTVNPVVRQATPTGRTTISKIDSFIIRRQTDGSVFTEMLGGPDGSPDIFYQQAAEPTPARGDKPSTAAIEIVLDDPSAVRRIPAPPGKSK